MNSFIAIGFVIFIILIVIKFFYPASQDNFGIQDLKESEIADSVNQLSDEYHVVVDESLSKEKEFPLNPHSQSMSVLSSIECSAAGLRERTGCP